MNPKDVVHDAQVVEKNPEDLHAKLKTHITTSKDSFRRQLADVNEAISAREEELKVLTIKRNKLQGAIEASDLYLNSK
jgi:hypothetical protein